MRDYALSMTVHFERRGMVLVAYQSVWEGRTRTRRRLRPLRLPGDFRADVTTSDDEVIEAVGRAIVELADSPKGFAR